MPCSDIVVIGTSAGGVEALKKIVSKLPQGFSGSVFVVLHLWPGAASALPLILDRAGPLPAVHPSDGERIQDGRIYVAPPDVHMILEGHHIRLIRGPRENRHRPAIDPLFRSAALVYGPRAVGVILTGSLDDGTAGLFAIKSRGGTAIVQDPAEAPYPSMPESAIQNVPVDHIVPLADIAPLLVRLSKREVRASAAKAHGNPGGNSDDLNKEVKFAEASMDVLSHDQTHPGEPSVFACPECHGSLWEVQEGEVLRYRCRVGHAYTSESLVSEMGDAMEEALWTALRAVEEMSALHKRLADRAEQRELTRVVAHHREDAARHQRSAAVLRNVLQRQARSGVPEETT